MQSDYEKILEVVIPLLEGLSGFTAVEVVVDYFSAHTPHPCPRVVLESLIGIDFGLEETDFLAVCLAKRLAYEVAYRGLV